MFTIFKTTIYFISDSFIVAVRLIISFYRFQNILLLKIINNLLIIFNKNIIMNY